jgi:geranylgeranyl diphosphate synthase type I
MARDVIGSELAMVRDAIQSAVAETSLSNELNRYESSITGGKMLRSRLLLEAGRGSSAPLEKMIPVAAAVELIHAASLLHDDVIDGGTERRHETSLWVSEGVKHAVLVGDVLLSSGLCLVNEAQPELMPMAVETLRFMCDAQIEQEIGNHDGCSAWDDCVRIARNKTGVLFGLAAAGAGNGDPVLIDALQNAGIDLGTAYQLADDMLDLCPDAASTGKSQGTDAAAGKLTAASAPVQPEVAVEAVGRLLDESVRKLSSWPLVEASWQAYIGNLLRPLVNEFAKLSRIAVA